MMNNFTPRAQQVLALARKEADRFNHNYVGTEHLVLGMIKLGQGVAVNVLQSTGLDMETVRMEIEKQVGSGPETKMVGNIPYTPRVKKVLNLAGKEAKSLNHSYVGTEHILLGLLREGESLPARIFKSLEVDIERTRDGILKELDPNFERVDEVEEVSPEADLAWLDHIVRQHPEIRILLEAHDEMKRGQDQAILEQDFYKAAELRDRWKAAKNTLDQAIAAVRKRIASARRPTMDPALARGFREISHRPGLSSRNALVQQITEALFKGQSVVLSSPFGTDHETLIEQVALQLFAASIDRSPVPMMLLRPDHLALGINEDLAVYEQNLDMSAEALRIHRNFILCLPGTEELLDPAVVRPRIAAAWRLALSMLNEGGQPFIALMDTAAEAQLRRAWPGIFHRCLTLEVSCPSRGELVTAISACLEKEKCVRAPESIEAIAEAIVTFSETRGAAMNCVEPMRSSLLCERMVSALRQAVTERRAAPQPPATVRVSQLVRASTRGFLSRFGRGSGAGKEAREPETGATLAAVPPPTEWISVELALQLLAALEL